jgi:hypothetical protein
MAAQEPGAAEVGVATERHRPKGRLDPVRPLAELPGVAAEQLAARTAAGLVAAEEPPEPGTRGQTALVPDLPEQQAVGHPGCLRQGFAVLPG